MAATGVASQYGGKYIPRPGQPQPTPDPTPAPATPQNTPNPAGYTARPGGTFGINSNTPVGGGGGYSATPGAAPVPGVTPTGVTWNVDPTGNATPYTPQRDPWGNGTTWGAGAPTDLNQQAIDNMMKLFGLMSGKFGSMGGPQAALPREMPGAAPGREVPSTMADRTAMESAQFGRAKDRIGQIGGAALSTLRDRSTAGGRSGSGLEAKDQREIVANTATGLGDVVRDQAINSLERSDQIDDRNLGTGVAQRGQDLSTRAGDLGSQVQQRGQDYNALLNPYQNPMMSMVPSLFGMFRPRY